MSKAINWLDTGWMLEAQDQVNINSYSIWYCEYTGFLESYKEDFNLGNKLGINQSEVWYRHMKSGAESGKCCNNNPSINSC